MNKTDLIDHVVENVDGLSKGLASKVVNAVFDAIQQGLKQDGSVAIIGHGTYNVVERAARDGRHPQTGAVMHIPKAQLVRFKAGKGLKDKMNTDTQ